MLSVNGIIVGLGPFGRTVSSTEWIIAGMVIMAVAVLRLILARRDQLPRHRMFAEALLSTLVFSLGVAVILGALFG